MNNDDNLSDHPVKKENDKILEHIKYVQMTCKRIGCTAAELLHMDYMKEAQATVFFSRLLDLSKN